MPSIFSKIIAGEIPCAKVWENEEFFAFLDIQPVAPGHTLVVPKEEIDYLFDLDRGKAMRLMAACHEIAGALKRATDCARVCVAVMGFEVPHAHVHLIPCEDESQFGFGPKGSPSPDDLGAMARRIEEALSRD